MKRAIVLGAFLFVFSTSTALAVSGACSHHRGVNCSVVSALDGNAICKDGWVSSVQYDDIEECKKDIPEYCLPPIPSFCATENDYQRLQMNSATYQQYDPSFPKTLAACRSAIINYRAQKISYESCLRAQVPTKPKSVIIKNSPPKPIKVKASPSPTPTPKVETISPPGQSPSVAPSTLSKEQQIVQLKLQLESLTKQLQALLQAKGQ